MSNKLVKSDDKCRICLESATNLVDIREDRSDIEEKFSLSVVVLLCTGLDLLASNPEVTTGVCANCEADIIRLYDLRRKCEKSIQYHKQPNEENDEDDLPMEVVNSFLDTSFQEETIQIVRGKSKYLVIQKIVHPSKLNEIENAALNKQDINIKPEVAPFVEERESSEDEFDKIEFKNVHKCEICGREFNRSTALKRHAGVHDEVKRYHCFKCDRRYASIQSLRKHHCPKKVDLICQYCDMKFEGEAGLASHMAMEHGDVVKFDCEKCNKHFLYEASLLNHICRVTEEVVKLDVVKSKQTEDGSTVCLVCEKVFVSKSSFNRHSLLHRGLKPHVCTICGLSFTQPYTLKMHAKKHHRNEALFCSVCEIDFPSLEEFNKHQEKNEFCDQEPQPRPYECKKCFDTFVNEDQLAEHTKAHHTKQQIEEYYPDLEQTSPLSNTRASPKPTSCENGRNVCSFCGKIFADKSYLRNHEAAHRGRRFKCELCPKLFRRKEDCKAHRILHTNERPHICKYCGKTFTWLICLRTHLTLHEGKHFKCTLCEKSFGRNSLLRVHMRSHTGEKPYPCTECEEKYTTKCALDNHFVRFHVPKELRPTFSCNICDKVYYRKSSLRDHMYSHKPDGKKHRCLYCPYAAFKNFILQKHVRTMHKDKLIQEEALENEIEYEEERLEEMEVSDVIVMKYEDEDDMIEYLGD